MIKIFIADKSYIAREGLKALIANNSEFELVGETDDSKTLSDSLKHLHTDVLIIDYVSRSIELEDIRSLKTHLTNTKILAITPEQSKNNLIKALDTGILSYILKDCGKDEIVDAIYSTAKGKKFFCIRVLDKLISDDPPFTMEDIP